ncbi:GyrI-like domain-containing protein [Alteromonadaceae bacterium BrNp21-10]|nr:GyrI-like domain-containing protein [Alteromonadaceae bacterium BrNp21-10]
METINLPSFIVYGLSVRTNNVSEIQQNGGAIGRLWQEFYANIAPHLNNNSKLYGVYTDYESDHAGDYSVLASTDDPALHAKLADDANIDVKQHTVAAGRYVVFRGMGPMPQAVIELWAQVWQFFTDDNCPYTRIYTSDFEFYKSDTEVEIYMAIAE